MPLGDGRRRRVDAPPPAIDFTLETRTLTDERLLSRRFSCNFAKSVALRESCRPVKYAISDQYVFASGLVPFLLLKIYA